MPEAPSFLCEVPMKALLILGVVSLMTLVGCSASNQGQPTAANNADSQGQAQQASAQQGNGQQGNSQQATAQQNSDEPIPGIPPLGSARKSH